MKISVQDVSHVNWEKVREQVIDECMREASAVVDRAQGVLEGLKPGERKTLSVKVGSITVARPK